MTRCSWVSYSIPHTPSASLATRHILSIIDNSQLPGFTEAWLLILANTFKWYISTYIACNCKLCDIINTDRVKIPGLILQFDTGTGSSVRRVSAAPKSLQAFKCLISIYKGIQQGHEKPCQNTTSCLSSAIKKCQ